MAEYEALLCGLKIAIETDIKSLDVRGDSQLVIDQVMKNSSCHDSKMEAYCNAIRALKDKFDGIELNHVPCPYNEEEDELTKIASGRITVPPNVFARDIAKPSVNLELTPSNQEEPVVWTSLAHYLGGYLDRLLGGPLGLPDLCRTVPDGVRRKDYGGEVLG
jgi:hypothetical protein